MKKIVLLKVDDWQALYVEGKLIDQGHRIEDHVMWKAIAMSGETPHVEWIDVDNQSPLEVFGDCFPATLHELVSKIKTSQTVLESSPNPAETQGEGGE